MGAETILYQEKDIVGNSHIKKLDSTFTLINKSIAKMIITTCRIVTTKKYDIGNKLNRDAMNKNENSVAK